MEKKITFPYIDKSNASTLFKLIAISGALGGFAAGYDLGIIGDALNVISIKLTETEIGLAGSGLLLGSIFSSFFAGDISDRLGRKWILVFDAIVFTITPLLLALATFNFMTFLTWRIIEGFALGMDNVLSGIFIAEMVPTPKRNSYVATQQLMTVIAQFSAFWIGYALTPLKCWRLMFALGAIPAFIILLLRIKIPESPRWLVSKGKIEKANEILVNFFKVNINRDELKKFSVSLGEELKKQPSWKDLFSSKFIRYTLIAIFAGLFMQFSGINAFVFYSPEIFVNLGYSKVQAAFMSGLSTGVALLWPVIPAQFYLIDRIGTKKAFLIGSAGMSASGIVGSIFLLTLKGFQLGISTIITLFIFIFFFEIGYGVALWSFSPEIFPTPIRGRGTSLFMGADSIAGTIVTATFPILLSTIGLAYTIDIYAIITLIAFIFFLKLIPDMKGKPLLEGLETPI